ncbi:MAG: hypothetical protein KDD61_12975, partial [Bdellovibrionales bacterium]|nr:hypothetical protein [Bdellovibrionales bacterium]
MKKILVLSFLSGFLATLIFHQGFVGLLYVLDILPSPPFNMSATQPFGVPSVISLSFFGGLWGVLIWWIVLKKLPMQQLILSVVMG